MKKRSLVVLVSLLVVAILATGAFAYFYDRETSNGNTFSAGSINLLLNNSDGPNVAVFTVANIAPDAQPTGAFTLRNTGTVAGYLNLNDIVVTSQENNILEPEAAAGDVSNDAGELQNVLNLRLYKDADMDGYWSAGDTMIFNGKVKDIATSYLLNYQIPAGGTVRLNAVFDWWDNGANNLDNLAMTDSFSLGIAFDLTQKVAK